MIVPTLPGDFEQFGRDLTFSARVRFRVAARRREELQEVVGPEVDRDRADVGVCFEDRFGFFQLRVMRVRLVQERERERAPGRTAGAVGAGVRSARTIEEGFGGLPRAAEVRDRQFGLQDFQRGAEVVDEAFFVVRGFSEAFVFDFFRELSRVIAVGERVTQRQIGVSGDDVDSAGGRHEDERSERRKAGYAAREQTRTSAS